MEIKMGSMSYIHYLCEIKDEDALIEEVGDIEMAKGFIEAHKIMRENKDKEEYKQLNLIVDKSITRYLGKESK
tara:strand:- start:236 stop:454 length:219 start_codon:yes stop_codon:yes gene_type:complete